MTLILAIAGDGEAVLAADSEASFGNGSGMYTNSVHKLRKVNGDRWIVGIANDNAGFGLVDYIESKGEQFNDDIHIGAPDYAERLLKLYDQYQHSGLISFFLAGTSNRDAAIYGWNLDRDKSSGSSKFDGIRQIPGPQAIGAYHHGAMHFANRFYSPSMSTIQRISLAHFCVSEACHQDPRVNFPVEIGLVALHAAPRLFTAEALRQVQARSDEIAVKIMELIRSSNPTISGL